MIMFFLGLHNLALVEFVLLLSSKVNVTFSPV